MKKRLLGLLVSVAALSLLVGCGSKGESEKAGGKGKETTISYALWDKEQQVVYKEIAKKFEEENPDIKIKFEITPWAQYWTKLETAITGNNAPDVFWMNTPYAQDYIDSGILAPLDDVKFDEDKFADQYLTAYSKDGSLYGIPKDFDSHALYYNKKLFDEAGVEYPNEDWTWDTWKEAAEKLTNKDKKVYGMSTPVTWQGGYYELIYSNGGSPFNEDGTKSGFDKPETIEALEFYHSFSEEGFAPPVDEQAETNIYEMLLAEKVAMGVAGSYGVPTVFADEYGLENIDIAPIPKGKTRAVTSNPLAHVMSSKTKHPEAAKKWIEYLSSKEAMEMAGESGLVLPVYDGSEGGWVKAYPNQNLQVFVDAKEYAVPLPNYKNSMSAISLEQDIFNDAWSGKLTIEEACKQVAEKANAQLSK